MPKIVILGSCRFEPYEILFVPKALPAGLYNTEEGYRQSTKKTYPAIDEADVVFVFAPDGIGEHTGRDLEYARSKDKKVMVLVELPPCYGKRLESYEKCKTCPLIVSCSKKTLETMYPGANVIG